MSVAADAEWESVWGELQTAIRKQPRCPEHPEFYVIETLARGAKHDIIEVSPLGISGRAHASKMNTIWKRPADIFKHWWEHLTNKGPAGLSPGRPDNPYYPGRHNHSVVVGAIFARCLPEIIEYEKEKGCIALKKLAAFFSLPEEVLPDSKGREGEVLQVTINRWERDPKLRRDCIAHYHAICAACGDNLSELYGAVADGFIHVHHLNPQSGEERDVDPVKDLRPVCPNCHAVIHLGGKFRTIEEVRDMRAAQRNRTT